MKIVINEHKGLARILSSCLLALTFLSLVGCKHFRASGHLDFIVLQLNDVYEIAPLEGGKVGGLARVATLRQRLLRENPNVLTVLAGDFLSPSLMGTLRDARGTPIRGAQMVEVMNALGVDLVTFGNHEFDIKEAELQQRLNESTFAWTSCNAWHKTTNGLRHFVKIRDGRSEPVPDHFTWKLATANAETPALRVGFIGVTIPFTKADYVEYTDVFASFQKTRAALRNECDLVLGITHQFMATDCELARQSSGVPLIIGGHDHDHMIADVGGTRVTKADANARTVYIHRCSFDPATRRTTVRSTLQPIDASLPADAAVERVVLKWLEIANTSLHQLGYNPDEVVGHATTPLEGREHVIRAQATNLGELITTAMLRAGPLADCALLNSGSVRLDDELRGAIRQYDILRTLPFGGGIVYAQLTGAELTRALQAGCVTNVGTGGFLQTSGVLQSQGCWLVQGKSLEAGSNYTVALTDFVSQGREANLEFLKNCSRDIPKTLGPTNIRNDLRDIVIAHLKTATR